MKTIFAVALAALSITVSSAAIANPVSETGGHYEWQNRMQPGPNKSNLPSRVRVWVKDKVAAADCDCTMMKDQATAKACMNMQGHGASHSKG